MNPLCRQLVDVAAAGGEWPAASLAAATGSTARTCGQYAGLLVKSGHFKSVDRHVEVPSGRRHMTFYSWTGRSADEEPAIDPSGYVVTDTHWGCIDPAIDAAMREMIKAGFAAMQASHPIVPRSVQQ